MPRSPREKYPGALYHLFNRGAGRRTVFHDEVSNQLFLNLLEDAVLKHQVRIHAFCLMKNHYHLMVKTPLANVDVFMKDLLCKFTKGLNQITGSDGPLFRSRYGSVLVETEAYFMQLSRYIHFNPVSAGLVEFAQDYKWSSMKHYLGLNNYDFLCDQGLKGRFLDISEYEEYVNCGNEKRFSEIYRRRRLPSKI